MADAPDPNNIGSEIRLDFMYDFEQKEFFLRFQTQDQAAAYQTRNTEARILANQRSKAWLPPAWGMVGLRSSSLGMAVVFDTEVNASMWRDRTVLGNLATFEGSTFGVYFKRCWLRAEMEKEIGSWQASLAHPGDPPPGPPPNGQIAPVWPNTLQGKQYFNFSAIDVKEQSRSSDARYGLKRGREPEV